MTYDKTTKKKIMAYAEEHTASAAIEKFDISRSTFYSWKKEMAEGYIKPERKAFYRKLNPEEVYQFVQKNPELTTAEIADHFGNVTSEAVRICLRKLGFSFKKRSFSIRKEMNKNDKNTLKK